MADWLQYSSDTLPWMRRQGEAAKEATAAFQFGAQQAQRQREEAYRDRVLQLQRDSFELKRQSELQANEGMVEVGKVLSEIAETGDWTNPAARSRFFSVVARYPAVTKSPIYDNLLQNFQAADTAQARAALEAERQGAITERSQAAIDARFQTLTQRFDNLLTMEGVKAENRKELEAVRAEFQMLRDQLKPQSGSHYDLPYSTQILMKSELDELSRRIRDEGLSTDEAAVIRRQIETKYRTSGQPPEQPKGGRVRVKAPDGRVGTISAERLEEALRQGYQRVE